MTAAGHEHGADFLPGPGDIPPERSHIDHTVIARCVGAYMDKCKPCGDNALKAVIADGAATGRLVEFACLLVDEMFGGIPSMLYEADAPGLSSPQFRRLVRIGIDTHTDDVIAECRRMSVEDRRTAASDALDLVVGHLTLQGIGLS
ncbi:hypothetical protein ACPESR_25460 [Nocardia testacea]|uniref:hypothetical protein n=1 Tax=Nocardia testacea TaxID=248551 RepID=UPI003C2DED76